jgi:hypothetical protein
MTARRAAAPLALVDPRPVLTGTCDQCAAALLPGGLVGADTAVILAVAGDDQVLAWCSPTCAGAAGVWPWHMTGHAGLVATVS